MNSCILILDNIRSVANVGSIFRTADCLGVSKIVLVGTTPTPLDRFGRKRKDFIKVSLGAENFVPWEYSKSIFPVLDQFNKKKIIALEQDLSAIHLTPAPLLNKERGEEKRLNFILIVGNEVGGISKEVLDRCDKIIEIPMKGKKESLNVSVATGIALFNLL